MILVDGLLLLQLRERILIMLKMWNTDIFDLKALKKDMKVTNVKKDEDDQQVRWNNDGSINWMRFEHKQPDTILYKVILIKMKSSKKIKAIRSLQQNATSKSSGYTLPKSEAELEHLLLMCKDLTIPSFHHQFYNELKSRNQEEEDDHLSESEEEEEWNYYIIVRTCIVRRCY